MSIRLRVQNWADENYTWIPPLRDVLVSAVDVAAVEPTHSRGRGPWANVTLADGRRFCCMGDAAEIAARVDKSLKRYRPAAPSPANHHFRQIGGSVNSHAARQLSDG